MEKVYLLHVMASHGCILGDMAVVFALLSTQSQHSPCCDHVVQPANDSAYQQAEKVGVQVSASTTCTST